MTEAEAAGDTVFIIEIDPNEGSGIVPDDWLAILQPKGLGRGEAGAVRGTRMTALRDVRALGGAFKRDYAYDAFWVVFSLKNDSGAPLFDVNTRDAELVVNIQGQRESYPGLSPDSFRNR